MHYRPVAVYVCQPARDSTPKTLRGFCSNVSYVFPILNLNLIQSLSTDGLRHLEAYSYLNNMVVAKCCMY